VAKVLSGSFDTKPIINSRYLTFSWSATQDIAKNQSIISWELKCNGTATTYNKSAPFSVVIDGEEVFYSDKRIELRVGDIVASKTKTITHNPNGSKKFTASVKAAIFEGTYNVNGSGTWELQDIPRKATLTKVPSEFTDEDSPTIEFTNPQGNNVDKLSVCLSLDNYYATIPYREVDKTATSYTFNFTEEEKAKIYEYTKNTEELSVSFYIRTDMEGLSENDNKHKLFSTLKMKNHEPELTLEVKETKYTDLTGSSSKMIRGYNELEVVGTPTVKKGATIASSYVLNVRGKEIDGLEGTITDTDVEFFDAVLIDSRGKEANASVVLEAIDYLPLTCNVEAEMRLDTTDGESAEIEYTISGNWFNGSFGAVQNALQLQVIFEGSEGGISTEILDIPEDAIDGNTYSATFIAKGFNYQETWIVSATAKDSLNTTGVTSKSKQLTAQTIFDWSKNDFNFNVPIFYKGLTQLMYQPGDSLELGDVGAVFPGFVSNAKKQLIFTIPLTKPLCGVTDVKFEGTVMCRSIAGYINGTEYKADTAFDLGIREDAPGVPEDSNLSSIVVRINDCGITVVLNSPSAIENATVNNAPAIIVPYTSLTINFI
jgi:hypothetical protein